MENREHLPLYNAYWEALHGPHREIANITDLFYKYYLLTGDARFKDEIIRQAEIIDQYNRVSQDPGSADYLSFYNQLTINVNQSNFSYSPYYRTGSSDDWLYSGGEVLVAALFARAYGLTGNQDFLGKAKELFHDRLIEIISAPCSTA